jgi:hypothetical protein
MRGTAAPVLPRVAVGSPLASNPAGRLSPAGEGMPSEGAAPFLEATGLPPTGEGMPSEGAVPLSDGTVAPAAAAAAIVLRKSRRRMLDRLMADLFRDPSAFSAILILSINAVTHNSMH